jgi:DNA-binding beta-propeller fold protein YncE
MSTQNPIIGPACLQQTCQAMTHRRKQQHRAGGRIVHAVSAAMVAGLVVLLSACGNAPVVKETRLVWPEPPETARIEFVRSITSDEDLAKDTTNSQSILKFLEGEKPGENRLVEPQGIAVSDDGERLYISDKGQNAVFAYDFAKKTSMKIGKDKPLAMPMGLALDANENIYVVEQNKKGVSVFDRSGKALNFMTDASISRPTGIAIDKVRGKVYVADTSHTANDDHTIKVFDLQGKFLGKVGLGKGDMPSYMLFPTFLAVDAKGHLFVSDTLNSRVQEFDADGKFVQAIGKRGTAWGQFDKPKGVGVDSFGNLYAVDSGWSNVQIFNPKGQVLMFFGGRGTYPGLMQNPGVLTIDKKDRIYVGDVMNHRVNVYQLVNTTAADSVAKEEPAKTEPAKAVPAKTETPKPATPVN